MARSVANAPGRDVVENARLLATAAVAMDDALITIFAPRTPTLLAAVTAIRMRRGRARPDWLPFIGLPMHPDILVPCVCRARLGAVLTAELGNGPLADADLPQLHRGAATRTVRRSRSVEEVATAGSTWRALSQSTVVARHGAEGR